MKHFILISLFLMASFTSAHDASQIVMGVGEQRLLQFKDIERFTMGNHSVTALHPVSKSDSLLIRAQKEGFSDLWVWQKNQAPLHRRIEVQPYRTETLSDFLKKQIGTLDEVEVFAAGNGFTLSGKIETLAEAKRIEAIARAYPKEIENRTLPSPKLFLEVEKEVIALLKKKPAKHALLFEKQDNRILIKGKTENANEREALEKELKGIYPFLELELAGPLDDSPTIYFRVFLLEVKKTAFHDLGLSWPAFQDAAFKVTPFSILQNISLDQSLRMMEGEGNLKVLSNPEMAVRAPGEAELFSGGEFAIKTQTQFASNVTWKNYGLTLKLKTERASFDRVRLDIQTEMSHIDASMTQEGVPGLRSNRMKTQVDSEFSKPLLLSGLLHEGTRETVAGLPLLREIPVLGKLFGSEDYQNDRSELVAILIPHLKPPAPTSSQMKEMRPRGPNQAPRKWIEALDEKEMRNDPNFPWSELE